MKIIIIGGPTASGKSRVALALAEHTSVNIINADSCQIYADLPILTAQPSQADLQRAPHHLYGILAGDIQFSVGKWISLACQKIIDAWQEGRIPVIVGGTGMYLSSLINGLTYIPEVNNDTRIKAKDLYDEMGALAYHQLLQTYDPASAAKLHPTDSQRVQRAMAFFMQTGLPLSHWQSQASTPIFDQQLFLRFVLNPERENLYKQCNSRLLEMIKSGALDEVALLKDKGDLPVLKALAARELLSYLNGELDLATATELAQIKTRNYAKRQVTWFRHQLPSAHRIDYQNLEQAVTSVLGVTAEFLTN